jgi:hypothetical protein
MDGGHDMIIRYTSHWTIVEKYLKAVFRHLAHQICSIRLTAAQKKF